MVRPFFPAQRRAGDRLFLTPLDPGPGRWHRVVRLIGLEASAECLGLGLLESLRADAYTFPLPEPELGLVFETAFGHFDRIKKAAGFWRLKFKPISGMWHGYVTPLRSDGLSQFPPPDLSAWTTSRSRGRPTWATGEQADASWYVVIDRPDGVLARWLLDLGLPALSLPTANSRLTYFRPAWAPDLHTQPDSRRRVVTQYFQRYDVAIRRALHPPSYASAAFERDHCAILSRGAVESREQRTRRGQQDLASTMEPSAAAALSQE